MESVHLLIVISMFLLIKPCQANFNMITSKKYDHYFLDLYQAEFKKHRKILHKNQYSETELTKFARDVSSGVSVRKWANFEGWNDEIFSPLHQHFLFAVRLAMDVEHIFPILVSMHVKYQAFLHAITYMNGATLLPGYDRRTTFCRGIASQLLYFSDVGMMDLLKKLEAILEMKFGEKNKFTLKILETLNTWVKAENIIWEKFYPRLISIDPLKNSLNNMEKFYQKLCVDQNEIMMESKKAMLSLFEGIKQSVVEPVLPPMERLTLNFAAASKLWDKCETTWVKIFRPSKGAFHLKEMIMEYDMTEMRFYGELKPNNEQDLNFDDLKNINFLIFHEHTGIIELAKINKKTGITEQGKRINNVTDINDLENSNQDEPPRKRKGKEVKRE